MAEFQVRVHASKAGSIGTKYCEVREYKVEANDLEHANSLGMERAYDEGLEHVLVTKVKRIT
jgi:hypothetical protein